jgi:molybdopterin/thiamine biosynthesis adenylyltransferase
MPHRIDLILQERHLETLRSFLVHDDRVERAAYILCGSATIGSDPWDRQSRQRLTSFEVLAIPPDDAISASALHVTWSTRSYVRLLKRAQDENLVAGIVHVHPGGPPDFSEQDDRNEAELAQMARNRNGEKARLLSLLLTGQGEIRARLWLDPRVSVPVDISVVGKHLAFHRQQRAGSHDTEAFDRQILAFGPEITPQLRGLKVSVVGCGGTGSATAMLLARLGVGQLALLDDDIVDVTNLNRLHGATRSDADAMRAKVDVVAREVADMALGTRVVPVRGWIGEAHCRDALKSCDVIFGCTDDHAGRLLLNRFAYFYLIPVIDMGLAIAPRSDGGLQDLTGRVTVLVPGAPCLLCRGVVDPIVARDEDLKRQHPGEYERRKREAYVRGAGNPAPAVVTFTTATACLAVDELLQALTCFRDPGGWVWHRVRRYDLLLDRRPGCEQSPHCSICSHQDYWGRSDVEPFLDRTN